MVQVGVQTGLHQEALPEGIRNELYQSNVDVRNAGEVQTTIVKALHDGASLNDPVALQLQREYQADRQFGQLAGIVAEPVILRHPPLTGVEDDLVSADAANWDTCAWFAEPATAQAILVPSFTLPAAAGSYFCRFTNATGDTDSESVVVS